MINKENIINKIKDYVNEQKNTELKLYFKDEDFTRLENMYINEMEHLIEINNSIHFFKNSKFINMFKHLNFVQNSLENKDKLFETEDELFELTIQNVNEIINKIINDLNNMLKDVKDYDL